MPDAQQRRDVLPVPDVTPRRARRPTTPRTRTPRSRRSSRCGRRTGAPNVLVVLHRRRRLRRLERLRRPDRARRPPSASPASGLKYNRFHTTALCSPTRAGAADRPQPPHASGMGGITEIATSAPGYNSIRPNTCAPLAETLKLNGYSTAQFGKCHEVPVWETSPMGPFDHWPTAAAASSTSTASSAARPTSTTRRSTRARSRSSPTRRPKRATTSWPT